jgi:hypothetical protein
MGLAMYMTLQDSTHPNLHWAHRVYKYKTIQLLSLSINKVEYFGGDDSGLLV